MAEPGEVIAYMDEVTRRARGEGQAVIGPVDRTSTNFDGSIHEARRNATLDAAVRESTRLRALKRLVLRLARVFTHQQVAFNHQLVDAVADVDRRLRVVQHDLDHNLAITRAAITSLEMAVESTAEAGAVGRDQLIQATVALEELSGAVQALEANGRQQRARLERLAPPSSGASLQPGGDQSSDPAVHDEALNGFYAELEERFRGARQEIIDRLKVYVGDIEMVKALGGPVVDIGCGRGEWLELLASYDVEAYGVDLNAAFAAENRTRGLDVRHGDGIAHLESLDPGSVAAVSAFHVVEHLPLGALVALIDAALRALSPGGLLILETPNPTNLIVGSSSFWLDPTHRQPIPPQLLEFMVANRGFASLDVRYLNPPDEPPFRLADADAAAAGRLIETLNWALLGPLDYAVVASKP